MSTRSYSDIPNRAVNIYLQEVGMRYDERRGLKPYRKMTSEVLDFFGHACAYCGDDEAELVEEHVVPRNRTHGGLHAWGNVVPACRTCNRAKGGEPWSNDRVEAFRQLHAYAPDTAAIVDRARSLYSDADELARLMVAEAVEDSAVAITAL